MLLVPIHGGVKKLRVDDGSERVIGRDCPHTHEALQTGVADVAISRSQLWVRCEGDGLIVESIGQGRALVRWLDAKQHKFQPAERHRLEPGCQLHFLAPRADPQQPDRMKLKSIAGWLIERHEPAKMAPPPPPKPQPRPQQAQQESPLAVVTAHLRDAQHAASVLKRKLEEEPGQNGAGLSEAKRRALSPVKQVLAYLDAGLAAAPAAQAAAAIEAAAELAPQPQQAAKPQRLSDEAEPKSTAEVGTAEAPPPRRPSRSCAGGAAAAAVVATGLRVGVQRRVPAGGTWKGGRLVLASKPSMHEGSTGAGAANGALVATFSLLDDAESLYRAQLPDLSVDVHVQVSSTGSANGNGNSKKDQRRRSVDFVHDTIVHGTNCFTAALLPGTGSLYDLGEQPLLGALTFRLVDSSTSSSSSYVEVLTCAVRKGHKLRGVGSLLAKWVLSLAAAHGVPTVLVAASEEASPFWRNVGFGEPSESVPSEWIKSLEAQFECSTVLACNSTTIPSGALDAWLDEAIARVQRGVTAGGARRPRPSV